MKQKSGADRDEVRRYAINLEEKLYERGGAMKWETECRDRGG